MLKTRTGGFPVGFRRSGAQWQKDLGGLIAWARHNDLGVIDLGRDAEQIAGEVFAAGMQVGSADLLVLRELISSEKAKRQDAVARDAAYVRVCAAAGVKHFFGVMVPEKPELKRAENFGYMLESLGALAGVLEETGTRLVIEGWPGPGALCCTPEGFRALFAAIPSQAMGINYDPSHLIRMGIDPLRFLEEFGQRVHHVHGKDTEILDEGLYEFGREQPATFARGHGFGSWTWRYTIPGHGAMRWGKAFEILAAKGYAGAVSIELEDEKFNGTEAGEQEGILAGARFLASC